MRLTYTMFTVFNWISTLYSLTTHLVLNGEIITKSPALKGAKILALPAEKGSWEITAAVVITTAAGAYKLLTAPRETPLGHLVSSVYDYIIKESLGLHVDYKKFLRQQHEEHKADNIDIPKIEPHRVGALIEKCHTAVKEMHRPMYMSRTASKATITADWGEGIRKVGRDLDIGTYAYLHEEFVADLPEVATGRISSYNSNTFKGRIYVPSEGRPVSFELDNNCRSAETVKLIVESLSENAIGERDGKLGLIKCSVFKNSSKSGHLKSYTVVGVSNAKKA